MLSGSQAKSEVGWEPCPSVASKPNDLAGERRGFRSRSTPGDGNKNGLKPIGLDKLAIDIGVGEKRGCLETGGFPCGNQYEGGHPHES
jgi:hypothetical protein